LRTRYVLLTFAVVATLGSFFPNAYAEDKKVAWGFSFGGGPNADFIHHKPGHTLYTFLPRVDIPLHRKWDLEFEGNFSYYDIYREKNLTFLGVNGNMLFTPIQWQWGSFFILGGGGLGYTDGGGRVKELGDSHLGGIIQGGIGIACNIGNGWALRGEYRLIHISDPTEGDDHGINTHTVLLGLSF
jgi:hypothetical protein